MSRTLSALSASIPVHKGLPTLLPLSLKGREGINSLFEYELLLATSRDVWPDAHGPFDWPLDGFIGTEVSCRIELDGNGFFRPGRSGPPLDRLGSGQREINGLVVAADYVGENNRVAQYRLVLQPWLHTARLTVNCRIFLGKAVDEIFSELFDDYPYEVRKRLSIVYPARDYQTQYNESDFAFFERLCQEWGISYHFEHADRRHVLVLVDYPDAYKPAPSQAYHHVDYHPPGWKVDAEYLHHFTVRRSVASAEYCSDDYDYSQSGAQIEVRAGGRVTPDAQGQVYEWHGGPAPTHYAQPQAHDPETLRQGIVPTQEHQRTTNDGQLLARVRLEGLRSGVQRIEAEGNLRAMVPGCTFRLQDHPTRLFNAQYLITETHFELEEVAQASESKNNSTWTARVRLKGVPASTALRPEPRHCKPLIGQQTAVVAGPQFGAIWTDGYGRIKIKFPWDRSDRPNGESSAWVRVASPRAGDRMGAITLPRVGQEVLIDFTDGDPDLPVCVGGAYNSRYRQPWQLPQQSALSGIRSRELPPPGSKPVYVDAGNHLVLDDSPGSIQAQLKSDHLHSQLSLGRISRIEDTLGRKDRRGDGFDLRTDGAGAIRTAAGLLMTTQSRLKAAGHMLERDELIATLETALGLARSLAHGAAQCDGVERETTPQADLLTAVDALDAQAVLALHGAAGIASSTPADHLQYAGTNLDTIAGRNHQQYAGHSILATARQHIDSVALEGDVRIVANAGKIIQQAQHNSVEITAAKSLLLTSSEETVVIRAKTSITLVLEDGTYLRLAAGGVTTGMSGSFKVQAAAYSFTGPSSLHTELPGFYLASRPSQIQFHYGNIKPDIAAKKDWVVVKAGGKAIKGTSDEKALAKPPDGESFDAAF